MKSQKFSISNDPEIYEAWPDIVLTEGKVICVFSECTHHHDRSYTRIMLTESKDQGRHWSAKHPLTEGTAGLPYYYNCARISRLNDGTLVIIVDRIPGNERSGAAETKNLLYFSRDGGLSWQEPIETPLRGIVPERLTELPSGRWLIAAHRPKNGFLTQYLRYSDDRGQTWSDEVTLAHLPGRNLCEVSLLPCGEGTIVAFMRENSGQGYDCQKTISYDNGETWGRVTDFPLPGCHRPTAGFLRDGQIFITYRFYPGRGQRPCNFFAALCNRESILSEERGAGAGRIIPLDYDRSPLADLGYSGWVECADGEIYVATYIVDDALDKGQIRGYALKREEMLLTAAPK